VGIVAAGDLGGGADPAAHFQHHWTKSYGNLYGDLLTYVISAALIFYHP